MPPNLVFRDAHPSEDDELARILYNAFQPIWNHNWFQNLSEELPTISTTSDPLTPAQACRLAFYRAWLRLNRAYNGDVIVAYRPTAPTTDINTYTADAPSKQIPPPTPSISSSPIAAVALLLPPHARPSWADIITAIRAADIQNALHFDLRGFYRAVITSETNVGTMITEGLKKLDIASGKEQNLLLVQGCVRNPESRGEKGVARRLLDWGIRRWWEREEKVPVWLDCTTGEGVRAFEEIGWRVVGECMVRTGCDAMGIRLGRDAGEKEREEGRVVAR